MFAGGVFEVLCTVSEQDVAAFFRDRLGLCFAFAGDGALSSRYQVDQHGFACLQVAAVDVPGVFFGFFCWGQPEDEVGRAGAEDDVATVTGDDHVFHTCGFAGFVGRFAIHAA